MLVFFDFDKEVVFSLTIRESKWRKSYNLLQLNILDSSYLLLSLQATVRVQNRKFGVGGESHAPLPGLSVKVRSEVGHAVDTQTRIVSRRNTLLRVEVLEPCLFNMMVTVAKVQDRDVSCLH